MSFVFLFTRFIASPAKGQVRLEWEKIMEYAGRITCCTAFVDDVIVFAIFLAVCLPLYQSFSFLKNSIE